MGILMEATERNLGTTSYRRPRVEPELFGAMGTPGDFFSETVHTIAINTRETEFGSIVEPIPITLKTYKQLSQGQTNGYHRYPQQMVMALTAQNEAYKPAASHTPSPVKEEPKDAPKITIPPPKKKWIKEYLDPHMDQDSMSVEDDIKQDIGWTRGKYATRIQGNCEGRRRSHVKEEPKSPVSARVAAVSVPLAVAVPRVNGVVRASPPPAPVPVAPPASAVAPAAEPAAPAAPAASALLLDFVQEHSRPRTNTNSHGPTQIPSPPSVGSNGSSSGSGSGGAPRAGTREVHNKLEKNRRAHLKECFELLKRQLPATPDDKKTSNLSILGSAIRYIQVLRRKERECEHEMERLAREKIAAQQRLASLKRDVPLRPAVRRPIGSEAVSDEKDRDETVNGQVLGIPISITSSPPPSAARMEASPPRSLNLSTKLHTLPVQITPTTSQVVRTSYGARHNTLTLTTLSSADTSVQNGQTLDAGALSALVHPAQIHLPLSPVVGSGGLVVGGALQLLGAGGLRVVHASRAAGMTTIENNRIPKENGIVSAPPSSTDNRGVVVSGLTPLVVSQPHLLHSSLAHKMVETQVVKGSVAPLTVSAQYLSATAIVKPVVVVSSAHSPQPPHPAPPT